MKHNPVRSVLRDCASVHTPDATVGIWTVLPSAVIRAAGNETDPGNGFIFSSIFAYNESASGLVLEDVIYHAPLEHTTWSVTDIVKESDPEAGECLTITMGATTNINKRLTIDGNPNPGSPGVLVIENWANVVVKFTVTTGNYSSNYDVAGAPDYLVNGSTEIKFDIQVDLLDTDIDVAADSAALDIGVMMMDGYEFGPTANDMPYVLQGYQEDEVSVSDPEVNETVTDGETVTQLVHPFQHRSDLKQIFEFVEGSEALGYFSWARLAQVSGSAAEDSLEDISTYYRTDGAALRVYLSSPMNETTTRITHDPSIGVFDLGGGGIIELPDDSIIGRSAMSLAIGLVIGLAAAAGAGTYVVFTRDADEDPVDLVILEKNRYYRK
jgi:hypothetical protein